MSCRPPFVNHYPFFYSIKLRAAFYTYMSMVEGHHGPNKDRIERSGIVEILYNMARTPTSDDQQHQDSSTTKQSDAPPPPSSKRDLNLGMKVSQLRNALPIKMAACHLCLPKETIAISMYRFMLKILRPFWTNKTMSRFRIHCGTFILLGLAKFCQKRVPCVYMPVERSSYLSYAFRIMLRFFNFCILLFARWFRRGQVQTDGVWDPNRIFTYR